MAIPSFDEFYSKVKASLPDASDELIGATYKQQFGADPVRTQGPTLEEFSAKVKARLPAADDALIRDTYQQQFGSSAGTAAKRAVASQQAGSNKYIGALMGGLGTLMRTVGMGDLAASGVVPAEDIGKTLAEGPTPGGAGESVFNYWDQVQQNNAPATALQGNVVDNPRLLANPAFWAQGLGGAASFLGSIPQSLAASPKPAADLHLANRITGPQAVGLGALETALNVLPFGSASRLVNAGLMTGVTGGTPVLEAAFTGDDMGQALKEGLTQAPFAALMGAALPVRPGRAPEPPPGARDDFLKRAGEATDGEAASGFDLEQARRAFPPTEPEPLRLAGPPDFVAGEGGVRRPGEAVPDPLALPAPRMTNQFEVDPQGNAIQLTEAQAEGADVARSRPNPLGLGEADTINARINQRLGIGKQMQELQAADVPEPVRSKFMQRYRDAARILPDYSNAMQEIGQQVGALEVKVAPLKGVARAVEKTMQENGGDVDRLKDLVRGTLVVDNIDAGVQAIERIKQRFGPLTKERNLLTAPETRDGYRDINLNALVDGQPVEVQINVPEMIRAKDAMHALYEERRTLDAVAERSAEQQARVDELDAQMKARYDEAWTAFKARLNSSSETSIPSSRSSPNETGLPSGEDPSNSRALQPPSPVGMTDAGIVNPGDLLPLTRKYTGDSPNFGKPIEPPPTARIVPDQGLAGTTEYTTPTGRTYRARSELVELEDILSSERPGYPAEVQPRQRDRASSQAQVDEMARGLRPDKLNIVLGPDNVVESGNGRTMALRRAAEQYPGSMAKYRAWLNQQGYDTKGMKNPVLVRRRVGDMAPGERAEFAREMNKEGKLTKGAAELALEDAAKLEAGALTQLMPGEISSSANAAFVRSFMARMSAAERGSMVDPDGALSADGIRRISNAVLAKAYGGDRLGNAVLARALESSDNEVRSVTGAMADAAPKFAELRQAIADGQVPAELDIGGKIAQAVEQTAKLRAERKGLSDYLAQEDAFNPHDPVVADLMRAFYRPDGKRAAGREQVAAALNGYADRALQQSLTQGDMLGGGSAGPREIMASVLRERPRESVATQGRLIAEPAAKYENNVARRLAALADMPLPQGRDRKAIDARRANLTANIRNMMDELGDGSDALWQKLSELKALAQQESLREFSKTLRSYANDISGMEMDRLAGKPTSAYAGKSVPSKDGQLAFDFAAFETRPDTTPAQVELGRAALSDLISDRDRRAGATVLADGLTRDFTQTGTADLVGQTVRSPHDLATLAQVYRDPRFETLRFFLVKGQEIVDHLGWTARIPGVASFARNDSEAYRNILQIRQRMRDTGADGYYILHNHPAGQSKPSDADVDFTRNMASAVSGFRRHVVIDHNEYSIIGKNGGISTAAVDFGGYDPIRNPRVPHDLLNETVTSDLSFAVLAKRLQANKDAVTLVTVDTRLRVRAVAEFPPELLAHPGRGKARIARFERGSGGGTFTFAIGSPESLKSVDPLLKEGLLTDSIQIVGGLIGQQRGEGGNVFPYVDANGAVVRSKRKASTQVADEPGMVYTRDEPRESLMPGAENAMGGGTYRLNQFSGLTPEELVTLTQAVDTLTPLEVGKQRRGERSWDATEQAAMKMIQQKYGITLDSLVNRRPGSAANAEQLEAYAQILSASTKRLTELAAEVNKSGSKEAKLALAAAKEKLGLMLAPALGYQTEAGRALNILRKTAKDFQQASVMFEALGDGSEKALEDFAKRLGQATNPDQVLGVTRAAYTPTLWDKFFEYWINGLLSGPTTHAVNMASNAMFQALDLAAQAGAGVVSKDIKFGAIRARVAGMVHGTTIGLRNAGRALLTGEPQIGGLTQVEHPPAIGGRLGKVIRTPSRLLTAEDEMFKAVAYHGELADRAMRQALAEKPANVPERFSEILGGMLRDPATMREARIAAERATFQTPLGDIGQAITMALNKSKVGRLIVPFVRTPTNILKRAAEFTPAGYGMEAVKSALSKGGGEAAVAHARIAIGSGLMLAMIGLASQGMVTGNGPQDPRERDLLMRQGWQPYSVKVGDRWFKFNRFEPVGMLMGMAADMHDIGAYASGDDLDKLGSMIMTSIALNLGDKTFLRGITDFSQAYSDPQRYASRWAQGLGSSMVPNILAQTARAGDPYMREAQTLMDAIKAKVPGVRENLAKKLDIAGEPIEQSWDALGNPLQHSAQKSDALADAMLRLDVMKGKPSRKLTLSGRAAELEPAEYEDYAAFVQQSRWRVLTPIVSSPQFQLLSRTDADSAAKLLDQHYDRIGEEAKSLWLFRHPNVVGRMMAPRAPRSGSQYADQAAGTL